MKRSKVDTANTRKQILAVAASVFMKNGVAATGIIDVMDAVGLTPGGFYRHFGSKEQLVAEAMTVAFTELTAMFDAYTDGKPAHEALQMVVQRYLYQLQDEESFYSCPLAVLSSELHHGSPEVRAAAGDGYKALVRIVSVHLMRMGVVHYVSVAEGMVATLIGAVSLSRLVTEASAAEAILKNAELTVAALVSNAAIAQPASGVASGA